MDSDVRRALDYLAPCTIAIMIVNAVIFFFEPLFGSDFHDRFGLCATYLYERNEYYRLLTYMFLHGSLSHLVNNMLVFAYMGSTLEKILGKGRFLLTYFATGAVAGMASVVYNNWRMMQYSEAPALSVGASGAIFGIVGAMAAVTVKNRGNIAGISSNRIFLYILVAVYAGVTSTGIDNAAHIGGVVFGFIGTMLLYHSDGGRRAYY